MHSGIQVLQEAEQLMREERFDEAENLLSEHILEHYSTKESPLTLAEFLEGPLLTQAKVSLARCCYKQNKFEVISDYAEDVVNNIRSLEDWMHQEKQRQNMFDEGRVKAGELSSEEALRRKEERDRSAREDLELVTWLESNLNPPSPPKIK